MEKAMRETAERLGGFVVELLPLLPMSEVVLWVVVASFLPIKALSLVWDTWNPKFCDHIRGKEF